MSQVRNLKSFEDYANDVMNNRYAHTVGGRKESWGDICYRVCSNILKTVKIPRDTYKAIYWAMCERKFIPGGRMLSQAGREYHQTDNCFMLKAEDTREGWAKLAHDTTMMFMSGGGVGVSYDDIRPYGARLKRSGGICSGPVPLIQMVNGIGAAARQGGERRGAIYASLKWDHKDIGDFINMKNNGGLEHTNISVRFNHSAFDDNPDNYYPSSEVFTQTLHNACKYGDPGFQFDWDGQILRNACTEIISKDNYDSCCLGSINLSKIQSLQELSDITQLGVIFLLAATEYTHVPCEEVREVKIQNRRLGLGLMGVGEWFIQRNLRYGNVNPVNYPLSDTFTEWLRVYQESSDNAATVYSNLFNFSRPIAVRAIAPTGTISIAGGHTTPGIEPVFHTAYERCYNTLKTQEHKDGFVRERVIEPIVAKWIEQGYNVEDIDTAYTLSKDKEGIERRIAFQACCQEYIDNGISSTVNLPAYKEGIEEDIAPVLLKYIDKLRGITFYPDGRYENQPVKPIEISDVLENNKVIMGEYEACKGGVCGI